MEAKTGEIVVVYVSAPVEEAPALARAIVERGLAACVNIVPQVRSIYLWENKVQDDPEALMIIKTAKDRFEALRAQLVELHSYDVPEVIAAPITAAHPEYLRWVLEVSSEQEA